MFFNPTEVGMKPAPFKHTVYNALVVPRPIGWISTLSSAGVVNLAPFSFFNSLNANPPCVMYCPNGFIDVRKVNPLARLGYLDYAVLDLDNMFSMRPPVGDPRYNG